MLIGFKIHTSAIHVLCNYCQQLQKPGAEFRGVTGAMALMRRFDTKHAREGRRPTRDSLHRTGIDKRDYSDNVSSSNESILKHLWL